MKKLFLGLGFIIVGFITFQFQVEAAGPIDIISLGISAKPIDIAVNESTNKIYAADSSNKEITVINGVTNTIIKKISIEGNPLAIAANKITNKVYVLSNGQDQFGFYLLRTLIDGNSDSIVSNFVSSSPRPRQSKIFESADITINEKNNFIIIAAKYFNDDGQTWRGFLGCFAEDYSTPSSFCGSTSFVNQEESPRFVKTITLEGLNLIVTIVDGVDFWLMFSVPGPGQTFLPPAYNCPVLTFGQIKGITKIDNNEIFVLTKQGEIISLSNLSTAGNQLNAQCRIVAINSNITDIDANEKTHMLYLTKPLNNTLLAVNSASGTVAGIIGVGLNPGPLATHDTLNLVYVGNLGSGTISVVEGFLSSPSKMINPTDSGTLKCMFRCKPSHEGIDVDKSLYQKPVKAPATGTIVKIDNIDDSNAGKWVWVNHGDITKLNGTVANKISTRYLHLDTIDSSLTIGQQITQGTIIGTVVGTGGNAPYIPHLHFEVRQGDIPLDSDYRKTMPLDPLGFVTYPSPIFSVTALSPVDLSITDPERMVIDRTRNDFGTAADYFEPKYKGIPIDGEDIDGYDMVSFEAKKDGNYLMRVIPEQGALPEETFTLKASICGVSTTLSENTLVSNIPDSPYILQFIGCSFERFIPTKIIIPTLNTEYVLGSQIQIQFSAVNNIFGTASISAKLNGVEVLNGQNIILTKPGNNTLEVTAIDNSGYATTSTQTFTVIYNFSGFLSPIKADGSGVYNLGRTLPVKFRLTDVNGNSVSTALAHLYVAKISDGILGTDEVPLSTSSADTGNQFRYDLTSNQYVYNLSTDTLSAGSWQLKVVLDSGQVFTVIISIK